MLEARLAKPEQPLDDAWMRSVIQRRGPTLLGISYRPRQVEAFRLEGRETLAALLRYRYELIRLAAYWDEIESHGREYDTSELDWQLAYAERAGKQVIISVGAVKNFGYPEFFVPRSQIESPIDEGSLVGLKTRPALLEGAMRFISHVVKKYRDRSSVVGWQLEHEAVDPLGMEHSWRLGVDFVEKELEVLRDADASRPVLMTGFLPTSSVVRLLQWWRTRDQGDSLAVAARCADIVGIDYYPRHALAGLGPRTLYLRGGNSRTERALLKQLLRSARQKGTRVMVSEGQSEPWETETTPPSPKQRVLYSCQPHHLIENFNNAMLWLKPPETPLYGYLFWGAEYWMLRHRFGDPSYLGAFARIVDEA